MDLESSGRRGVASVIGTVFFVLVFMLALGAMAYMSGVQGQSSQAALQVQQVMQRRGAEQVEFTPSPGGLTVTNLGPVSVILNHVVLKFPNGTVYSPAVSAALPSGGAVSVQSIIPSGVCSPGAATCLSKYNEIVQGNPAGSEVGVLTSLGNSFWYEPSSAQVQGELSFFEPSTVSTSSGTLTPVTGLSFVGAPAGAYIVELVAGYYQSAGTSNLVYFGVSAPADAKILACSDVSGSSNPYQASCSSVSGTTLPQPTCYTQASNPVCSYSMTVFIVFGPGGGTLQVEFRSNGAVTAYVVQGSYMTVSQVT